MSDWQVGDLALCVKGGVRTRDGVIYTVSDICLPWTDHPGLSKQVPWQGLRFAELPDKFNKWSDADRFRKIRPDAHEACEEEFVTLLKRKKVSA